MEQVQRSGRAAVVPAVRTVRRRGLQEARWEHPCPPCRSRRSGRPARSGDRPVRHRREASPRSAPLASGAFPIKGPPQRAGTDVVGHVKPPCAAAPCFALVSQRLLPQCSIQIEAEVDSGMRTPLVRRQASSRRRNSRGGFSIPCALTTCGTKGLLKIFAAAAASWVFPTPGSPRTSNGRFAASAARIAWCSHDRRHGTARVLRRCRRAQRVP